MSFIKVEYLRNYKADAGIIILSASIALLFWKIAPIYFSPDSEQYFSTAVALAGNPNGKFYYYRTLGYPLVLLGSGTIHFKTLLPILMLQAVAATFIPWLIYRATLHVARELALPCAILCIFSFTPYFLQNLVMTDEISMILMYAAILFIVRYACFMRLRDILLTSFCVFLWMMLRPAANLAYIAIVIPLFLLGKKGWKYIFIASISLFLACGIFHMLSKLAVSEYNQRQTKFEKIEWASFAGKMFFWNIYGPGSIYAGTDTITPTNGPYSRKMYDMLLQWGIKNPMGIQSYLKTDDPKEYAKQLMAGKNLWFHSLIWLSADQMLGPKNADKLFWLVALEGAKTHPKAIALFWDGIVEFLLSGEVVYNNGNRVSWGSGNANIVEDVKPEDGYFPAESTIIPKTIAIQIRSSYDKTLMLFHHKYFLIPQALFYWETFLKIIAIVICACLGGTLWRAKQTLRVISAVLLSVILYQAMVCALFASPFFRYIAPIIPAIFMLAACCIASFRQTCPSRFNNTTTCLSSASGTSGLNP